MNLLQANTKISIKTYGCKVNFAESSFIANQLKSNGYCIADFNEKADIYIIHSCVLTQSAEKKTRYSINKVHKKNPKAKIIVIGCDSQINSGALSKIPAVNLVLGNESKFKLAEKIQQLLNQEDKIIINDDVHNSPVFNTSWSFSERTRCFLKVQDGCDNYCNYCIVPYARGKSRSSNIDETIKYIYKITEAGFKEIVLTGINLGDFGKQYNQNITELLTQISKNTDIERIRISSLEPYYFNEQLLKLFANDTKLMPHFHIPIQSGSDKILQLMGRKHNTSYINSIVVKIKNHIPDACIAVDVITSFSSETDDDHKESMDFYNSIPIAYMHVFPFSLRKGTVAYSMKGQVDAQTKKNRTDELLALSGKKKKEFYLSQIGKNHNVLIEAALKNGFMYGFTENYVKIKIQKNIELINNIIKAKPIAFIENEEVLMCD